ncbi:NupC/NupG family nucleoside CNT transporter [Arcticibacterium luteifluviistationis]|uniref:NupC/NupG family nucleoside CNT transporter n=1 Tax=Arcticibacterium luteifluviistationis TaxID=1784714 RepID=A0A2Z4G9H1_9BACT|nr:nucleoside transporter C-terminal domain-containing protein [Arcticibacterium luteifluviistationis]AWV97794.1 NupC/NupG family nucleoside CNT transporter [Arcticibacterium luteifluviistationis]
MERFTGLLGIVVLLGIAFLMSNNKKKINIKLVLWGLGLQLSFALLILKTPIGLPFFKFFDVLIGKLLSYSDAGGDFLFKSFVSGIVDSPNVNFAIRVLPTVIFFSALVSLFYHLGIMQRVVKAIAWVVQKTMGTSGSETLSVAGSIFVGQTEAPLLVKPFIKGMTKSELMTIMVAGFATIAGGVMAIYVKMLEDIPGIAGHLMAASIMNAPAAVIVAKIMFPETEESETKNSLDINVETSSGNVVEAVGDGAVDGLKLAANIGAMLIAIVAIVAMLDGMLGYVNTSLAEILGVAFKPLAWTMGVPWSEATAVGGLLGEKIVLTELIAYADLRTIMADGQLSQRSSIIASYALCGFANFASIGIQLGGIGGIAPERKKDIAKLATKAMIGGAIASNLTACIAGILI